MTVANFASLGADCIVSRHRRQAFDVREKALQIELGLVASANAQNFAVNNRRGNCVMLSRGDISN
jgi:hypothetical protein